MTCGWAITATTLAETRLELLDPGLRKLSDARHLPRRLEGAALDGLAIPGAVLVTVLAPSALHAPELRGPLGAYPFNDLLNERCESAFSCAGLRVSANVHGGLRRHGVAGGLGK